MTKYFSLLKYITMGLFEFSYFVPTPNEGIPCTNNILFFPSVLKGFLYNYYSNTSAQPSLFNYIFNLKHIPNFYKD